MRSHRLVGAAAAAALLFVGCTAPSPQPSTEPAGPSSAPSVSSSTPISPTATSPSTTPSAQCPRAVPPTLRVTKGTLPNGKSFGLVQHFDGTALYVDPAEFLGGDAAVRAAREDGEIGPHEDLPDPFYIRNHSKAIVRIPVSAKLRITVLASRGGSPTPEKLTAGELAALYCDQPRPDWVYGAGPGMTTNLTVVDGEVTRVEEQYTP